MKLTINTPDGIEEYESGCSGPDLLEAAESDAEAGDIYEGVQLLEDVASDTTRVCREFELGSISGASEFLIERERICTLRPGGIRHCIIRPVGRTRTSKITFFASVCVPEPIPEDAWKVLGACVAEAFKSVILIISVAHPASFIPVVKAAVISCLQWREMTALADSFDLGLFTRQTPGAWRRAS